MNVFYVNKCPYISAMNLVDKHIVKMIIESGALLSTAHRVLDGEEYEGKSITGRKAKRWRLFDEREDVLYLASHVKHLCGFWVRESIGNYNWLADHLFGLLAEYKYRYDKDHKVYGNLSYLLSSPPLNLRKQEFTTPPSCMDKQYIISKDPIENYRNYYRKGKTHLFNYKRREPPEWIRDLIDDYDSETCRYFPREIQSASKDNTEVS